MTFGSQKLCFVLRSLVYPDLEFLLFPVSKKLLYVKGVSQKIFQEIHISSRKLEAELISYSCTWVDANFENLMQNLKKCEWTVEYFVVYSL